MRVSVPQSDYNIECVCFYARFTRLQHNSCARILVSVRNRKSIDTITIHNIESACACRSSVLSLFVCLHSQASGCTPDPRWKYDE